MAGLARSRVVVTGGTGFIGSHLVEELIKLDCDVHVVDVELLANSYFSERNLAYSTSISFCDITDYKKTSVLLERINPEYVFHLAAQTLVTEAIKKPLKTYQANIMGTINILESLRQSKNIKKIIVASSDKAYGKVKDNMYKESDPLSADFPYDVSKSAADLITQSYFKTFGMPVVVTRFGNVYGEGDLHFDRIIPGICKAATNGEKLLIRSDGKYIRDYLYVKDVVSGYLHLAKIEKNIFGEAFNFASKDTLTVIELINVFEKITKKKINYKILNEAKHEIEYQHLNDLKIRKLGWKNEFTLHDTLPAVFNWYANNI